MTEFERRLATVEAQYAALDEVVDEMAADVKEIKNTVVRSKGFIAGAATVIVPLWGAVVTAVVYVWHQISGSV